MNVIPPLAITDALLTSSTVAEPDTGEVVYSAGTTYALANVVISTTTHLKYTSLQAGNIGHPLSAAIEQGAIPTVTDWWVKSGPTNRWSMFDPLRSTATVAPLTMRQVITPGVRVDALALHGLVADMALVTVNTGTPETGTAQAGAASSLTMAVAANTTPDFYQYMACRITSGTGAGQSANVVSSRKNWGKYSQDFANAVWSNANCILNTNVATAPDGTLTAEKLIENTTAGVEHFTEQTWTLNANQEYTTPVYIHAGETASFVLMVVAVGSSNTTSTAYFSVSGGVITAGGVTGLIASSSAQSVGGGWYRCFLHYTLNGTVTSHRLRIYPRQGGVYTGDGTSGIYPWGAELKVGFDETPYIMTAANAAVGVAIDTPWAIVPDATSVYEIDQYAHLETLNGRDSFALFDLPPFTNGIITVTLSAASGNVECGSLDMGIYLYIGDVNANAENDALNFSTIVRNFAGSTTLLKPRPNVPKTIQQLLIDASRVDAARNLREALAGIPATWSGVIDNTDGYSESLLIHAKYDVFRITLAAENHSLIDLELEEI